MIISVLNGSPKGEYSITLQTVRYLEKLHPEHTFDVLHVGQRIRLLEKDFSPVLASLGKADLILFCYPVYSFLAPYPVHRFMELLKESGFSLTGKFVSQLTTSKHFYDVTAHRYVEENCTDMGMRIIRGLSADMDDLLSEKGQTDAVAFLKYAEWCVQNGFCEPIRRSAAPCSSVTAKIPSITKEKKHGDVVIVTDLEKGNVLLQAMIGRFRAVSDRSTRVVNIREFPFDGGCLGCFRCAVSGKCIYKDRFDNYLRDNIQNADAILLAFTVRDHSMGARFKLYDDRQFCNGHRAVTAGKPMGYLVSGNLSAEDNLRTLIEARAQVGGNFLCGIATDKLDPDGQIDALAATLSYALENRYIPPANFYGVGGMKLFRDLIWQMQGMMRADHKFYKAHGQYDFPQKKRGRMLASYALGALLSNPKILAKMGNKMNEGMIAPYKKLLRSLDKSTGTSPKP